MNMPLPNVTHVAASRRIATAGAILDTIKSVQTKDGTPDFPPDVKDEFGDYIGLLCEAGFVRKIDVTGDGFPYRITWKGLCFLDIAEEFDYLLENNIPPDSIQGCITRLAVFSFH